MKTNTGETMNNFRNMVAINSFTSKILDLISKENENNPERGFEIANFKTTGQNDLVVFNVKIKISTYEALWAGVIIKILTTASKDDFCPNCIWDVVGFKRGVFNPAANIESNENKTIKITGQCPMSKLAVTLLSNISNSYINYLRENGNDLIDNIDQNRKEIGILEDRISNAKTEIRQQNELWKKTTEEYETFLGNAARFEEQAKLETQKAKTKLDMMNFYKERISELKLYVKECENKIKLRTPDNKAPILTQKEIKMLDKSLLEEEIDPGILSEEEIEALQAPL